MNKNKITTFQSEFFGGCQVQTTFNERANIIVGGNGTGKTTLLKKLACHAKQQAIPYAYLDCIFDSLPEINEEERKGLVASFLARFTKPYNQDFVDGLVRTNRLCRLLQFIVNNREKAILLIDGIETGLHMVIQKNMLPWMTEKTQAQVFVTTHSPDVIPTIPKKEGVKEHFIEEAWRDRVFQMHHLVKIKS